MSFSSIIARIAALFLSARSVDDIVAVLTKVADQLSTAEARHTAKVTRLNDRAHSLLSDALTAASEADRAARVRAKLAKLID